MRADIAQTWPRTLDDSQARADWGWRPRYDLSAMARDMITQLRKQVGTVQADHPPAPFVCLEQGSGVVMYTGIWYGKVYVCMADVAVWVPCGFHVCSWMSLATSPGVLHGS